MEIRFEDNTDMVRNEFGRMISRIPEMEEELAEEMMEIGVEEIRASFKQRFDDFSGETRKQISMRNVRPANVSEGAGLRLPLNAESSSGANYLEWNEKAKSGHWVSVTEENRPIKQWAEQNFNDVPSVLKVEPTPFIKPAMNRIKSRMETKAKGENNAVAEFAEEMR